MTSLNLKDLFLKPCEDFPFNYQQQGSADKDLGRFLKDQRKIFEKYNCQKRVFVLKNRKEELFK